MMKLSEFLNSQRLYVNIRTIRGGDNSWMASVIGDRNVTVHPTSPAKEKDENLEMTVSSGLSYFSYGKTSTEAIAELINIIKGQVLVIIAKSDNGRDGIRTCRVPPKLVNDLD